MRLTIDTTCVIDAAQAQPRGPQVVELVDLAHQGRVGPWITEAFTVDQQTAPLDKAQLNLAWLSQQPVIGRIPGPWRLGHSGVEGPDGFPDDDHAAADLALREIILTAQLQRGRLDENDPAQLARNRDKVTGVQHLTAHRMAGHDAFVTSDDHDILRHQEAIRRPGLQAGVHPKVVAEVLGHANIGITLDTYSHAVPAMQESAAETIAALVFGGS
jgi:hypothetical protein